MKNIFVGLLVVANIGCSAWEQGSGNYQVYVDDNFSAQHKIIIHDSVESWSQDVERMVSFEFVKSWKETDNLITITPSTLVELTAIENGDKDFADTIVGYTTYEGTSSVIQLSIDVSDEYFSIMTQHELGHALGLVHTSQGQIMNGSLVGCAHHVTCLDLMQFCGVWGCEAAKMDLCK